MAVKQARCEDCKGSKEVSEYNEPHQELHENKEVKIILCNNCYYERTLRL